MSYHGDIRVGKIIYFHFTTRQFSTGAPITSASLAISVYKNDSTTESTSGITTTFSGGFDGRAGLVSVKLDTSSDGTFYAAGNDFSLVVTGGTADSVSIVGEAVRSFSIENRSALMPTTDGRKLDIAATGEAGLDFNNVLSTGLVTLHSLTITGAVNLSSTLAVAGATTLTGLATGALSCTTLTASGAVAFQSTFAVTTSTALGALSCTTLTAAGAVAFQSTFAVTTSSAFGAVTCSTFAASSTVTFNALTITTNLLVSGTATITGATTFTGAISGTNAANDLRGVLLSKNISAAMDELAGDPGATPTGAQALMLPFMGIRNKRDTTAVQDVICNSGGSVILAATLSDDTVTFEKGKYA